MPFAILRTAKLSKMSSIAASASHNFRERETPNADLSVANESFGAQSSQDLKEAIEDRLKTVAKVRSNAVLAVEYFIGASPEFFQETDGKGREAFFADAHRWLVARHGVRNVVGFTIHNDETSPHACAYVVPIDQRGKLNAREFLGGRQALSTMQSDFAERVGARHGLQRGIERSGAHHTTVKEFYGRIQAPTPAEVPVPELPQKTLLARALPAAYNDAVRQHEAALAENAARRKAIEAKAVMHEVTSKAKAARDAEVKALQVRATQMRELPLTTVLEWMDCKPDAKDKNNFQTPAGRITVTGQKFFNHDLNKGGRGAIDLVMQLHAVDYKTAVGELGRKFGTDAVAADLAAAAKQFTQEAVAEVKQKSLLPEQAPEKWAGVRDYLVNVRKLSAAVVDWQHELKKLFADGFGNACFVLGKNVGVELRGTVNDSTFHGVRGSKGSFSLGPYKDSEDLPTAVVKSAIDALSLRTLGFRGRITSTTGEPGQSTLSFLQKQPQGLLAAFDNNKAGDAMAARLGADVPRLRPKEGKDWNEELISKKPASPVERFDVDLRLAESQALLQARKKKTQVQQREGWGR